MHTTRDHLTFLWGFCCSVFSFLLCFVCRWLSGYICFWPFLIENKVVSTLNSFDLFIAILIDNLIYKFMCNWFFPFYLQRLRSGRKFDNNLKTNIQTLFKHLRNHWCMIMQLNEELWKLLYCFKNPV